MGDVFRSSVLSRPALTCESRVQRVMNKTRIAALDLTRPIGMFFVMLIHSSFIENGNRSVAHFILKMHIGSGAVPMFFLLAGYLSARDMDSPEMKTSEFIAKKARRLIVPFLFWNVLLLVLVFAVKLSGASSALRGSGAYLDVAGSPTSILSALVGVGRFPIVYQFWFLRDLIVVSIACFLLRGLVSRIPFLPWMLLLAPLPMAGSMGFYLLGYSTRNVAPTDLPRQDSSAFYCVLWIALGVGQFYSHMTIPPLIQRLGSAVFILMLSNALSHRSVGARLSAGGALIFFVYAAHEPLQTTMAKSWQLLNIPGFGSLWCFLVIPAVAYVVCWLVYRVLRRYAPRLMPFMTGDRQSWDGNPSTHGDGMTDTAATVSAEP